MRNKQNLNPIVGLLSVAVIVAAGVGILFRLGSSSSSDPRNLSENAEVATSKGDSIGSTSSNVEAADSSDSAPAESYRVLSVIDGDTIKIEYEGKTTSVRLIGVNTPETVDPRKDVECYGKEASDYLKSLLTGKTVTLGADPSQTNRDKYDRLLRYVYLDGQDVNYQIIAAGYGYEYTYNIPYQKQASYKAAEAAAEASGKGLWAPGACNASTTTSDTSSGAASNSSSSVSSSSSTASNTQNSSTSSTTNIQSSSSASTTSCRIKGNISSSGEKIYHVPDGAYYNKTEIDTSKGERWFCSEQEAQAAGWRRSKR